MTAVQILLMKPSELLDLFAAMAALESLVDIAREKGDARNILIKLIASKEEVAKAIQNSHKEANSLRDAIAGRSQLSSHYCKRGGVQLCPRLGAGQVATWVRDA
ncbi:hypothetical protein OS493_012904 [Desmophyllum pertusum]|uniref:Uncharacterized protein n=1 Tax=Desmophyllum pertusum TaxID=174260 RepID=A0A9W9Z416_9CNID|nr:hypothetical protein OS493_012904 [Desmophyllum pertusum]